METQLLNVVLSSASASLVFVKKKKPWPASVFIIISLNIAHGAGWESGYQGVREEKEAKEEEVK